MKIKLLVDYRGVLTHEAYYTAGQYSIPDDMPESYAKELVKAGRAVMVDEPTPLESLPEPEPEAKKTTTRKPRTRRKKAA